jgi:hypothetical protein
MVALPTRNQKIQYSDIKAVYDHEYNEWSEENQEIDLDDGLSAINEQEEA